MKKHSFIQSLLITSLTLTPLTACNGGGSASSNNLLKEQYVYQSALAMNKEADLDYWLIKNNNSLKLINVNSIVFFAAESGDFKNIMFPISGFNANGDPQYITANFFNASPFTLLTDHLATEVANNWLQNLNVFAKDFAKNHPQFTKYCVHSQNNCYLELAKNDPLFLDFIAKLNTLEFIQISAALWDQETLNNPRLWFIQPLFALAKLQANYPKFKLMPKEVRQVPAPINYAKLTAEALDFDSQSAAHLSPAIIAKQLQQIKAKLNAATAQFFQPILNLTTVKTLCQSCTVPAYIYGDMDGSFGRVILAAVSAGLIKIDDPKILADLVALLHAEQAAISNYSIVDFQASTQNAKYINNILNYLIANNQFYSTNKVVIFLGDIVWDRLSCDISAMKKLLQQLHKLDVIFILGNHDNYAEAQKINPEQAGEFAVKQLTQAEGEALQKDIFQNAYYNSVSKLFVNHAGLKLINGTKLSFGFYTVDSYQNLSPIRITSNFNKVVYDPNKMEAMTNFRPQDKEMQLTYFVDKEITIVHGHEGNMTTNNPKVINLNSRINNNFGIAAAILGR